MKLRQKCRENPDSSRFYTPLASSCQKCDGAQLKEADHRVLFYENIEGGHGGASNNAQAAFLNALIYEFLHKELDGDGARS
ncbi:hypothetical protein [Mycobacterium sp. 852002-51057_SCH5723018]|uniref:hypothetical protein n=1 Tax=Mycobacterium sp. 852002-51057_SCH5723018 TaxID=1834094 RepID=UPI0007FDF857|nr:hypothetical protein [Mycobacterium sp. 852002-51057_SCH5723018]OBG24607.1 hypothetical protein A5764_09410 [Mycobacterium sp. 852002-51057_SCH5723018]